jgi:NitT/TauT family transport system ATP-binding protein
VTTIASQAVPSSGTIAAGAITTESAPSALITLRGVSKRYANGMQALSAVDLTIGDGEFVSLLGPSGCGKSTLLRLIAGLGPTTEGTIEWAKGAHGGTGRERPDLGFVFQEPTLMPWATVFNNVYLPLKLAGMRRRDARPKIEEALAMVGLERFAEVHPRQLSGGMKMRVSIARALVTRPRVLLLDEPFAALDEITRFRLNNDLLALWQRQHWTVVFVTHSVFESVYLSQRVVVMRTHPGRVASEIVVSAPYPRDESFRTSSLYNDFCRGTSLELSRVTDGREEN